MKKILRPYQQELLDEVLNAIPFYDKICVQLSTGGGKTVIFTEMINQLNAKTLILVDSIDLVNQTYDTFSKQGIDIGKILAGCKVMPQNQVIVAMIGTLYNKVKLDNTILSQFKYCVIDEAHVWIFNKLFPYLNKCKIIGFTATPVRLKRYKIDKNTTAQETMSDVYEKLICGKPIKWLIENKYLVRDENHLIDFDYSGLKTDSSGEFTQESMKAVFQSKEYQKALRYTYDTLCDNKKTMIFTSSTETNAIFAELFKDKNVMTYDSKNNKTNERDTIIDWFKNTPDAILINTGCFTKGFDVDDVECIIAGRATKSLSLWIQICGRGARITNKIYKDKVIIIDGGNNIQEHGIFSFERDWYKIFKDKKTKLIIEPLQECESCGFTFSEKDKICPNCGEIVKVEQLSLNLGKEKEFTINGQKAVLKPPTINIDYFIEKDATSYEALKVLAEKWVYFLTKSKIEKDTFEFHLRKGTFDEKFELLLKPFYRKIISRLKESKRITYYKYKKNIINKSYMKKYGNIN